MKESGKIKIAVTDFVVNICLGMAMYRVILRVINSIHHFIEVSHVKKDVPSAIRKVIPSNNTLGRLICWKILSHKSQFLV